MGAFLVQIVLIIFRLPDLLFHPKLNLPNIICYTHTTFDFFSISFHNNNKNKTLLKRKKRMRKWETEWGTDTTILWSVLWKIRKGNTLLAWSFVNINKSTATGAKRLWQPCFISLRKWQEGNQSCYVYLGQGLYQWQYDKVWKKGTAGTLD